MTHQWEKQKREVDSYNLFFSSFIGVTSDDGLFDIGYRLVGEFVSVSDHRKGVTADPDFVLYNGETMILAEIKAGENINDHHISQMERCNQVSIEAGRDFLRDADFESDYLDANDLERIQPLVIYYADFLTECREYPKCVEALTNLSGQAPVLSQEKGGQLILEDGSVNDNGLRATLEQGISLPKLPEKNICLPENIEREMLSFSICHDLVLNNIGKGRLSVTPGDVIERYSNREMDPQKVEDALDFLEKAGACSKNQNNIYDFTRSRIRNIVRVDEKLEEKRVVDWLDNGENPAQQRLGDFSNGELEADGDG